MQPVGHDTGPLAFLGGDPWRLGAGGAALRTLLAELVAAGPAEVVLVPTAAAYERPERLAEAARAAFGELGASVLHCPVLGRGDAENREHAALLRQASFIYLAGGSPLHLRSVLKDSTALAALLAAWHEGATVVGAGAGATTLCDPMVDPRGGAFSVGLGLVRGCAVVTGYRGEPTAQLERTLALAPVGCAVIALPDAGAVVRAGDGTWRSAGGDPGPEGTPGGRARPTVFVDGADAGLSALVGKAAG